MSVKQKSWKPTNKWWAAQCTGMATLAVAWVNAGGWNKPLTIALIGFVSQATAAYLVSNAEPSTEASGAGERQASSPDGLVAAPSGMQSTAA